MNSNEDKENVCTYCNKTFKSFIALEYHFQNLVCLNYDYECKICNKDFCTKSRLYKHQNSRTKCNLNYLEKINNLKKKNNLEKIKKPVYNTLFECIQCGKRYTTNRSLKRHVKDYCKGKIVPKIQLNNFGKEDLSMLTHTYFKKYVNKDVSKGFIGIFKDVYFNPLYPQNFTIYHSNIKSKKMRYYNNDIYKFKNIKIILEKIMKKIHTLYYEYVIDNNIILSNVNKKKFKYLDEVMGCSPDEILKMKHYERIKEKIMNIILDNRNIVKPTFLSHKH